IGGDARARERRRAGGGVERGESRAAGRPAAGAGAAHRGNKRDAQGQAGGRAAQSLGRRRRRRDPACAGDGAMNAGPQARRAGCPDSMREIKRSEVIMAKNTDIRDTKVLREALAMADLVLESHNPIGEITGTAGTGKSMAGRAIAAKHGAIRVAAWEGITRHQMLSQVAASLGIEGAGAVERLLRRGE